MIQNLTMRIGFLIFPGFPMACLTSMIEPLRAANEIAGQDAFSWTLISETGGRVISSAKVAFEADRALSADMPLDLLFVLGSPTARFVSERSGNGALRALGRHGVILGSVSGGVFPLVRSGVVGEQPVSVHWCYETAFKVAFPDVRAVSDVIVTSATLYTVSGAAAAFDLALRLIETRLRADVAHEVACWFQHPLMRGEGVRQRVPVAQMPDTGAQLPDLVARCVEIFAANLEMPVSVADVANQTRRLAPPDRTRLQEGDRPEPFALLSRIADAGRAPAGDVFQHPDARHRRSGGLCVHGSAGHPLSRGIRLFPARRPRPHQPVPGRRQRAAALRLGHVAKGRVHL